jgi:hypothetical protein
MRLGAENRSKLIAASVLGVVALVLTVHFVFGLVYSAPASAVAPAAAPAAVPAPIEHPRVRATGRKKAAPAAASDASLDPTLRFDWLKSSEDTKYEGLGRNIFRATEIPTPVQTAKLKPKPAPPTVPLPPPGPPPPPPINLKFFGFASKPGESKKIFLSQGDDVFIAGEGEIVDRRYKIVRISPFSVEIEDVLNNNRQVIPLSQGG